MVSVFKSTSIWESSMTHSQVFSVWTSMLSLRDQEAELVLEEDAKAESVQNTESQRMKLWNGSEENMMELSTTDKLKYYLIVN